MLESRCRPLVCSRQLSPLMSFLLLFLATVGLEELTGESWISELFARSMIPVGAIAAGLALMANLAFVVTLAMMRTSPRS